MFGEHLSYPENPNKPMVSPLNILKSMNGCYSKVVVDGSLEMSPHLFFKVRITFSCIHIQYHKATEECGPTMVTRVYYV